jgi:hypothetical protein
MKHPFLDIFEKLESKNDCLHYETICVDTTVLKYVLDRLEPLYAMAIWSTRDIMDDL